MRRSRKNLILIFSLITGETSTEVKYSLVCSGGRVSGGPLEGQSQPFFLTIEVAEIIPYREVKPYENVSFLTDLYLKRGWSLRRISNELDCSKATVRKKLIEAGVELFDHRKNEHETLRNKIRAMKEEGQSFQGIADKFNLWKIPTRSGEGMWHPKTIREIFN
jgi:hypothetical protein